MRLDLGLTDMDKIILAVSAREPLAGRDPARDVEATPWYQYARPTLGSLLRAMLRELGLSQRDLALRLGIHYVTVNRIVRGCGGRANVNLKTRMRIEQLCLGHHALAGVYRLVEWSN